MGNHCFQTKGVSDGFVIALNGRIGGSEAEGLQSELDRLVELSPKVMVLDMAGVTMLSSAALSALVRTGKRTGDAGAKFRLASVPEPTMKLMQSVRLDNLVPIFTDVSAALR